MRTRDDIDPENTWVTSDQHFGHDNIVGFCHRPLDHDQVMIAEWRAHVPEDATLLHLGDLCYKGNARFKHLIAKELTGGRKLLIKGNHDHQRFSYYRDCGFKIVSPFAIRWGEQEECERCNGKGWSYNWNSAGHSPCDAPGCDDGLTAPRYVVSFSHYAWSDEDEGRPIAPWDLRIHGHIHNNGYTRDGFVPFLKQHINVSVEQTKYRPVNLKLLLDATLLGEYPETTPEQLEEARERSTAARKGELK